MTTVLSTIPTTPTPSPPTEAVESTPADVPAAGASNDNGATPADATAPDPVEVPKAVEPERPDPDLEIARKLDAVTKREARARRQEAELQQLRTSIADKEKTLTQKLAELDAALEDPVSYYLQKGKDPVDIAKRFAKPMTEEEKRLKKLEERYEKDEEDRKRQARENEERSVQARRDETMRRFVGEITQSECPFLTALYEPHEVPGLVNSMLHERQDPTDPESPTTLDVFRSKYGRSPTDKELREALEHRAELRATSLQERIPKKDTAKSQVTPPTPPATSTRVEESTSLSNQHAASSSSGISRNKSREEVMKELKDQLEAEASATE